MPRPITLFTGQWADLPLAELAPLAKEMGYDGLELACWGDHFEVRKALSEDGYVEDYIHSEPRFRALVTEGASEMELALV